MRKILFSSAAALIAAGALLPLPAALGGHTEARTVMAVLGDTPWPHSGQSSALQDDTPWPIGGKTVVLADGDTPWPVGGA
ncbi:hypothetical protein EES43_06995 [Streptomyces sp. ADI96-02]|uniref:hypothetical protein n=1 Tax=unclassified Streptomyces TaxID=2593676 RepID=UPI000F54E541|nr:hypothetical protein [Streptomyces sp. ADI96-02]RPK65809.1 hypothetical protein EES43_06995 [Streptomyces sp. ADI96-02]